MKTSEMLQSLVAARANGRLKEEKAGRYLLDVLPQIVAVVAEVEEIVAFSARQGNERVVLLSSSLSKRLGALDKALL